VLELVGHGRAAFALVGNVDPYTYAGRLPLHVTPEVTLEGGLDAVAPRRVRARTLPRLAAHLISGRGHARGRGLIYVRDLDRLEIRCDVPQPLQMDGEDLGDVEAVLLESERAAVDVFVS
jgi:diacylglycerol kinase family enzyme